jgi:tryptophanyl-tRNA synthetase
LEEPKNPDTCIVFKLYSFLADERQIAGMREKYIAGGYGYGHAKKDFLELILSKYKKQREVFDFYMENPEELEAKLRNGEAKAKEIAAQTMDEVRKLLKFA